MHSLVIIQNVVGFIALIITPFSTLPQLYKTFREKKVGTISFSTFWILWIGLISWFFYSIFQNETSIFLFLSSFLDLSLLSSLLFLLYKYSKNKYYISMTILLVTIYFFIVTIGILKINKIVEFSNSIINSILINIGSFCIAFASLPQIIKIFWKKEIKGISLFYKSLVFLVELSWFIYWLIAGLLGIWDINEGVSVPLHEMIQLMIWASLAVFINLLLLLILIFKNWVTAFLNRQKTKF